MELGPFDLDAMIGEGGMGSVWSGVHRDLGVPVAVKVMSAELAGHGEFLAFFQREVRALARLAHPAVIWVYDHGVLPDAPALRDHPQLHPGLPYLVMDRCDATLRDRAPYLADWDALRDVFERLLDALAHAHAHGVIHCDLKLDNILVRGAYDDARARPELKLCDFGIALFRGEHGAARGTPSHMAPEQFSAYGGRQVGPWSDLYALGVLGWTLATGYRPFDGDLPPVELLDRKLALATPPYTPRIALPEGLEGWLGSLLAPDPGERFRSAADARAGLRALERAPSHVRPSEEVTLPPEQDLDRFRRLRPAVLPTGWRGADLDVVSGSAQGAGLALLGLRATRIVGREAEREAMWRCLVDVTRAHRPSALVLEGEEGVGTTALARWLCARAEELGGLLTVEPDGRADAGDVSLALLCALLRLEDLTDPTLARERLALLGADYGSAVDALEALLRGVDDGELRRGLVLQVLAAVSRQRPVVVFLDAIDGRDALRTLLARGMRSEGSVLWLATARASWGPPALRVPRLTDAELIRVLAELLPLHEGLAAEIAARSVGRPKLAVEALRALASDGDLELVGGRWALRPRADLRRELLVERWLEGLDDELRRAAFLAAVIGRSVPASAVFRAAGALGVRVAAVRVIEEMSRRGWLDESVGGWRFRSPAVRGAVLDFARGTLDWFGLHTAAAEALAADGAPPVRIGEVMLSGGSLRAGLREILRDLDRIREHESRETALSVVRDAQEPLEAATLLPEEDLHGALWRHEVDLLRELGRAGECVELALRVLDSCQDLGWRRTGGHVALSLASLHARDEDESLRWIEQALRLLDHPPDRARALERKGALLTARGALDEAEAVWRDAVRALAQASAGADVALSARLQCVLAGLAGDHAAAFALGRVAVEHAAAHAPAELIEALILEGEAGLRSGAIREGRASLVDAAGRAALRGAASPRALAGIALADALLAAWASAEQSAWCALEAGAEREVAAVAEAVLVLAAARRGRPEEALRCWAALAERLDGPRVPSDELAEMLESISLEPGTLGEAAARQARRERRRAEIRRSR